MQATGSVVCVLGCWLPPVHWGDAQLLDWRTCFVKSSPTGGRPQRRILFFWAFWLKHCKWASFSYRLGTSPCLICLQRQNGSLGPVTVKLLWLLRSNYLLLWRKFLIPSFGVKIALFKHLHLAEDQMSTLVLLDLSAASSWAGMELHWSIQTRLESR